MRKIICIVLIAGFAAVDFLFFHDVFKPGETITAAQYLVGILSLLVFAVSAHDLLNGSHAAAHSRKLK